MDSVILTVAIAGDVGGAGVELNVDRFGSWIKKNK